MNGTARTSANEGTRENMMNIMSDDGLKLWEHVADEIAASYIKRSSGSYCASTRLGIYLIICIFFYKLLY